MTDSERPLSDLRFALVGAGAVGSALGRWLAARGATLTAVAARGDSARAAELARRHGARHLPVEALASGDADLLLLAVPDAALPAVSAALAHRSQAPVALHVAGALGPSTIAPLASAGCALGGFHPLRAFPAGEDPGPGPPAGIFFALGGEPAALALGRRLAEGLGGTAAEIEEVARPLYHLAATLLAGGMTTLAATAYEIRRRAGLPPEADAGYARLALDALERALGANRGAAGTGDPASGITGPAARGDLETFVAEAQALAAIAPEALPVVIAIGRESLRQRARLAPWNAAQKRLAEALERADLLDLPRDRVLTSPREPHG